MDPAFHDGEHAMTNRMTLALLALSLTTAAVSAQTSAPASSADTPRIPSFAITVQASPSDPPDSPPATPKGLTAPGTTPPGITPPGTATPGTTAPATTAPTVAIPTGAAPARDNQAFWVSADAVFSVFRAVTLPPLVTTSPPGTAQPLAGVLGVPGTTVLFGGNNVEGDLRYGFRVDGGYWFGQQRRFGIEAGVMMLGSSSTSFAASSSLNPILARPFTDATNFTQQAALIAFPGISTGSININSTSGHFYSGDLDFAAKLTDTGAFRLTGLLGYRYFRYGESLDISQTLSPTSALFIPGTQIASTDHFSTRNMFNGMDVGVRPHFAWQALTLDLLLRVAVGNLHHTVDIAGNQVTTSPGFAPVTQLGGVLALPTNIGQHTGNEWIVFPEVGVNLGWRITSNVQLRVGYGLLWLNNVTRAPDQINTTINPQHFPGVVPTPGTPNQPAFNLNRTDIWIQNANVGLEFTF
jgi:hypothetical protein